MNRNICVSVFGNPSRVTGARHLDIVGKPSMSYEGLSGINRSPFAIEVKVGPEYTAYIMSLNNIKTHDGENGTLKLGLSIPARMQLAGGRSPFELLMRVKEKFFADYMIKTITDDVSYQYKFDSVQLLDGYFAQLLAEYTLESVVSPYVVMGGTDKAVIELDDLKASSFLCDVFKYRELSSYSSVVVASAVDANYYKANLGGSLEIPRQMRLTLVAEPGSVLAKSDRQYIPQTQFSNPFLLEPVSIDKRIYECQPIHFCVKDLMSGKGSPNLRLEISNEILYYRFELKERRMQFNIRIIDKNNKEHSELLNQVKISTESGYISHDNGRFVLMGKQLAGYSLVPKLDSGEWVVASSVVEGTQLIITVQPSSSSAPVAAMLPVTAGKFKVVLDKLKSEDFCSNGNWAHLCENDDEQTPLFMQKVQFSKAKGGSLEAEVQIPQKLQGRTLCLYVSSPSMKSTIVKVKLEKNKEVVANVDASKLIPLFGYAEIYKKVAAWVFPVTFLVMLLFGIMLLNDDGGAENSTSQETTSTTPGDAGNNTGNNNTDKGLGDNDDSGSTDSSGSGAEGAGTEAGSSSENPRSPSKQGNSDVEKSSESTRKKISTNLVNEEEKSAADRIKEFERKLSSPSLRFDELKTLLEEFKNFYQGLEEELQKKFNEELKKLSNLFRSYVKVCNILMEGSSDEVKALGPDDPDLKKLDPKQRYYVLLIYHGEYYKDDINKNAKHTWIDHNWRFKHNGGGYSDGKGNVYPAKSNKAGLKEFCRERLKKYNTFSDLKDFMTNRPVSGDEKAKK